MSKKPSTKTAHQTHNTHDDSEKDKQLEEKLARTLADYQNLEKRFERDSSAVIKLANVALITKLLEVRDHLGMASQNGDKSLGIILSSFDKILVDEGVATISTEGEFNPAEMECAELAPGEKDTVIVVQQAGYKLGNRVLRPARVTVGNGQK